VNRRQFLTRAIAAVPAVTLAPTVIAELLEELAPARTIILPPAMGWVSSREIAEITARAFVPKLIAQIYATSPLLQALLANSTVRTGGLVLNRIPL
jgi:hypothetical protein